MTSSEELTLLAADIMGFNLVEGSGHIGSGQLESWWHDKAGKRIYAKREYSPSTDITQAIECVRKWFRDSQGSWSINGEYYPIMLPTGSESCQYIEYLYLTSDDNEYEIEITKKSLPNCACQIMLTLWEMKGKNNQATKPLKWRLPTQKELMSAYATGVGGFNRIHYWSSTVNAYNTSYAWIVYFYYGSVNNSGKTSLCYVRCVRGVENDFNNLEWGKTAVGGRNWAQAVKWCEEQNK
jgi:hypothetical protein